MRILLVEDSPNDALLIAAEVERTFPGAVLERVETPAAFAAALDSQPWDAVLADHNMPGFSAFGALELLQKTGRDIPFIVVSGSIGEELAVAAMKAGAQDYVTKQSLSRLGPAIDREVRDALVRADRIRTRSLLHRAQERLAAVLDSTQDCVFTFDAGLRITAIYGSWLRAEGRTPEEFLGKDPRDVLGATGDAHELHLRHALAGGHVVYEWSRPEGAKLRHFQTSLSPLRSLDDPASGGVGITREITELKEVQGQLVVSERMVALGTLAASVAHEINNPLACIIANLEAAGAPGAPGGRPEMAEAMRDAKAASERVRDVVRDLRILSRGDEQRVGPIDVRQVLDSAVRLAWNEVRHRATVVREYGDPPPVRASESRLGQVFLNLIVNAAQAISEGSAATNRIVLRARAASDAEVAVEVEDSGCGMSPEVLSMLFTPFYTTKEPGLGTGLGLSISRRIITELGGRIEVASRPGEGSVFRVLLPAETAPAVPREAAPRRPRPEGGRRARVLVVDDDALVGKAIRRTLRQHEVTVAEGQAAVARIEAGEAFDVVLCDLMMPVMTGMQVHARIRAAAPALAERMIFISGGAFTPAAQEFLRERRPRLVQKPFDPDELRRIVDEALA